MMFVFTLVVEVMVLTIIIMIKTMIFLKLYKKMSYFAEHNIRFIPRFISVHI